MGEIWAKRCEIQITDNEQRQDERTKKKSQTIQNFGPIIVMIPTHRVPCSFEHEYDDGGGTEAWTKISETLKLQTVSGKKITETIKN